MQYSTPPVEKFLRRCWLFMVDLSLRKWSRSIAHCLWEAEIWGLHRMIGPGSLVKSLAVDFPFQNHELKGEVIRNHLISVVRNLTFSGNYILVVCCLMILEVLSGGACQLCCFWALLNKKHWSRHHGTCCTLEIGRPISRVLEKIEYDRILEPFKCTWEYLSTSFFHLWPPGASAGRAITGRLVVTLQLGVRVRFFWRSILAWPEMSGQWRMVKWLMVGYVTAIVKCPCHRTYNVGPPSYKLIYKPI